MKKEIRKQIFMKQSHQIFCLLVLSINPARVEFGTIPNCVGTQPVDIVSDLDRGAPA